MRITLRTFCGLAVALAFGWVASVAEAAPWYARGEFNNWGTDNQMAETSPGSGVFSTTVSGLAPGTAFQFKVASSDWGTSFPANNSKTYSDAAGKITFYYYAGAQGDGASPGADRVGYADPGIAWDLMGSFNNWTTPVTMSGGSGVYTGQVALAGGTPYEFKFRKAGDWGLNIGQTFENDGPNAAFTPATTDTYQFQLDLVHGDWQVAAASGVPEPASMALLGVASLALLSRRRGR
jgi:1,4-alpha-glucan branching enzyme